MKSTSVTNLKASLSFYLRHVKSGSRVLITEHDTPIAVIYPYGADEEAGEKYAALVRDGLLTPPRKARKVPQGSTIEPLDIGDGQDRVIKALLDERVSGL